MDDADIYGQPFYEIGFAEAVSRGHITDYKVIVICVTDSEVKALIEKGGKVITDQDDQWDAKALAKRIALVKGIRAYGLRKAFTFHGRIDSAKAFTDTDKPYGIDKIFKLLEPETQKSVGFFHVNGTMSSGTRSNILKEFESVDIGIISNARCLVEGVNIPAVDMVAFIDPKRSLIDIVQATGRAMRKADWKKNGYIFIPVFLEEDSDPEEIIKNSDFSTIWEVLQAMLDQDQRMQSIVSKMRILQGKSEEGTQAWKDAMTEYAEKIEFYDLPTKIDQKRFIERLNTRIVEIIGRQWDFWYGLTLRYKDEFDNPNTPWGYNTSEGYSLNNWQRYQRGRYRKRMLSLDRIERLEKIGFKWDMLEEQFEKGFQLTLHYKERTGNPNVPALYKTVEGFLLGSWQSVHTQRYKQGKMSPERIKRLEEIGFTWNPFEEKFEKGFQVTLLYKERTGNPNAPAPYKTTEGFRLGNWQSSQRNNYRKRILSPDRIRRLEEIGFTWAIIEEQFEKGFQETVLYKESTGSPNAPDRYKTPEGYTLGTWQRHQMINYSKGMISPDRIKKLEDIGFTWSKFEEQFEKGFKETLLFKERTGNPNAPRDYKTTEGFTLGSWQSDQRKNYRKGKMPQDRIEQFEKIGFIWEILEEKFEKGFKETLLYKEKTGNPNAPKGYKTNEGYLLGSWQSNLMHNYKKGNLSSDRIKRLEDIGFTWERLEEQFEKGFQETLLYKESSGNPNASQRFKTDEGFTLGTWQSSLRGNYKKGNISAERIKRLEEIGFKWGKKR
jgi:hypothetical protein